MPGTKRADRPHDVYRDDQTYPDRLVARLGAEAPERIAVVGSFTALSAPMTAFLCSQETPGATILKALDQAAEWRDAGRCVISGFHSPLEQQCLDILLRGKQPIMIAFARGLGTLRLPAAQRKALDEGRLTIISAFPESAKRATADLARRRNRFVAALACEVVFGFVSPGGNLSGLADELAVWRVGAHRLHC